MAQQETTAGAPTMRTCLQTFASNPMFYITCPARFGANTWEPAHLIAYLEQINEGRILLAHPAAIFEYHEHDPEALRETAVAGIYLISRDGRVGQQEEAILTVYRIFALTHFRNYIARYPHKDPLFTSPERHPLLLYGDECFSLSLEILEDPHLLYYRIKGGVTRVCFPLWAILLHKLLTAIKSVDKAAAQAVDWQATTLALIPMVERLALHTDWLMSLPEPLPCEGRK